MSTNVRFMACTPEDVFAVLADGWLYPTWVVGASRMRDVDQGWPAVGSRLQHSFGAWPALINDETTVIEWDPPRVMAVRPRGGPLGEAHVTITVQRRRDGCIVRITERAVKGLGALIPDPLLNVGLHARNTEALRRLAYIAEGRRKNGD